jgi:DNA replication protein DnaC
MSNVLEQQKQQEILALGRLGWTLTRIGRATGVHRVTVGDYLRAAGIPIRRRGRRDPDRSLENFDFDFNKKMNRALIFDLATARFIQQREDALFLGPPGTGKSHLAQAIGRAAIQQGYRVTYREAHTLLEEIAEAAVDGTRKALLTELATVPLLIIDDLGMRKLPHTAAEDLLELIMRPMNARQRC